MGLDLELIKSIVPDMILVSAKSNKWYNDGEDESIMDFNGDMFQEYYNNAENDTYNIELTKEFGGYEGAGEDTWLVFCLTYKETDEKVYFRLQGWYNSWDSTEWQNEPKIVQPVEVMKIEWKEV